MSLTIHSEYKYFDYTVQSAEDRRQKFHFCRLPFVVNVMLKLSNIWTLVWGIFDQNQNNNFNKAYFVLARHATKIGSFHFTARSTNGWKLPPKVMSDSSTFEALGDGTAVSP